MAGVDRDHDDLARQPADKEALAGVARARIVIVLAGRDVDIEQATPRPVGQRELGQAKPAETVSKGGTGV